MKNEDARKERVYRVYRSIFRSFLKSIRKGKAFEIVYLFIYRYLCIHIYVYRENIIEKMKNVIKVLPRIFLYYV